jgi:hypothetical protein
MRLVSSPGSYEVLRQLAERRPFADAVGVQSFE